MWCAINSTLFLVTMCGFHAHVVPPGETTAQTSKSCESARRGSKPKADRMTVCPVWQRQVDDRMTHSCENAQGQVGNESMYMRMTQGTVFYCSQRTTLTHREITTYLRCAVPLCAIDVLDATVSDDKDNYLDMIYTEVKNVHNLDFSMWGHRTEAIWRNINAPPEMTAAPEALLNLTAIIHLSLPSQQSRPFSPSPPSSLFPSPLPPPQPPPARSPQQLPSPPNTRHLVSTDLSFLRTLPLLSVTAWIGGYVTNGSAIAGFSPRTPTRPSPDEDSFLGSVGHLDPSGSSFGSRSGALSFRQMNISKGEVIPGDGCSGTGRFTIPVTTSAAAVAFAHAAAAQNAVLADPHGAVRHSTPHHRWQLGTLGRVWAQMLGDLLWFCCKVKWQNAASLLLAELDRVKEPHPSGYDCLGCYADGSSFPQELPPKRTCLYACGGGQVVPWLSAQMQEGDPSETRGNVSSAALVPFAVSTHSCSAVIPQGWNSIEATKLPCRNKRTTWHISAKNWNKLCRCLWGNTQFHGPEANGVELSERYPSYQPPCVICKKEMDRALALKGLALVNAKGSFLQTGVSLLDEITNPVITKWEPIFNASGLVNRRHNSTESTTDWQKRGSKWFRQVLEPYGISNTPQGPRHFETAGLRRAANVTCQKWHADTAPAGSMAGTALEALPLSVIHPLSKGGTTILMIPLDNENLPAQVFIPDEHVLV